MQDGIANRENQCSIASNAKSRSFLLPSLYPPTAQQTLFLLSHLAADRGGRQQGGGGIEAHVM